MKTAAALAFAAALAACGGGPPGQLTPQEARDWNDCKFRASTVGGFNLVNQQFNQEIAFRNCLAARGY